MDMTININLYSCCLLYGKTEWINYTVKILLRKLNILSIEMRDNHFICLQDLTRQTRFFLINAILTF